MSAPSQLKEPLSSNCAGQGHVPSEQQVAGANASLICLQFWHKACFHCEICKMTLNMKNYKGYEKKPYCNA